MDTKKFGLAIAIGGLAVGGFILLIILKNYKLISATQLKALLIVLAIAGLTIFEYKTKFFRNLIFEKEFGAVGKKINYVTDVILAVRQFFKEEGETIKIPTHTISKDGNILILTIVRHGGAKWENVRIDLNTPLDEVRRGKMQLHAYDGSDRFLTKKEKLIVEPKKTLTEVEAVLKALEDTPELQSEFLASKIQGARQPIEAPPTTAPQQAPTVVVEAQKPSWFWKTKQETKEEEE